MADGNLEALRWVKEQLGRGLSPRERQFIETRGYACTESFDFDNPRRPESASEENRFDAQLIRWLLAKEIPGLACRAEGVELAGLWVENELDLDSVDCGRALKAMASSFREALFLQDTTLNGLYLPGSSLPGLAAGRLTCNGPLHLRYGFKADGSIQLGGAKITGQIDCSGGSFEAAEGPALGFNVAEIGADVLLRDGFSAKGEVNFRGAQIKGQLACYRSNFEATGVFALVCDAVEIGADVFLREDFTAKGKVDFMRAQITGHLICRSAMIKGTVDLEGAQIGGGFFWENISGAVEVLDLTETKLGRLNDDAASWGCVEIPKLSGFRYDSIQSDMTVQDRLALLARKQERKLPSGSTRKDFDPQPYSQLAKVYDTIGHRGDAAKVRLRRDVRLASARLARAITGSTWRSTAILSVPLACISYLWSQLYRATFGFGYAPFRAFGTALVLLFGTYVMAENTYQRGEMAPASPVVLTSTEWLNAAQAGCAGQQDDGCTMPLRLWEQSVGYRDYETFSPALYALDLFLPLDTLAQEESWSPSKDRGPWGWALYWGRWLIQLSGWLLLTTAAAVFSGVLGKKD